MTSHELNDCNNINKIYLIFDRLLMEPDPPVPSEDFRNRIIYQNVNHIIPKEFVLKKLEMQTFQAILTIDPLSNLTHFLSDITTQLSNHNLEGYLDQIQINYVPEASSIFNQFKHNTLALIAQNPFYLGVDRTYMQQLSPKNEFIIDHEREFCFKWHRYEQNKKKFMKIYKYEQLIIIGEVSIDRKQYKGVKVYNNEVFRGVEVGIWKQNTPIKNLAIKYHHQPEGGTAPVEIYYRHFEGKKLKKGMIRFIQNGQVQEYVEPSNNQTKTTHPSSSYL